MGEAESKMEEALAIGPGKHALFLHGGRVLLSSLGCLVLTTDLILQTSF